MNGRVSDEIVRTGVRQVRWLGTLGTVAMQVTWCGRSGGWVGEVM